MSGGQALIPRSSTRFACLAVSGALACGTGSLGAGGASASASAGSGASSAGGGHGGGDATSGGAGGGGAGGDVPVTIARALSDDVVEFPQYLAVRKSGTEIPDSGEFGRCVQLLPKLAGLPFYGNAHTCVIFNLGILDAIPDRSTRVAVMAQGFEEARVRVGKDALGDRRLAVHPMLDLLNAPVERLVVFTEDLYEAATLAKVPIVLGLDAVNWWEGRPDLWNFFDEKRPGYDPKNVENVEWTGYSAGTAPKVFWRNWGFQIRVETPIPNTASPKFRAAIHDVLAALAPIIRGYADRLTPDERWRYAGVVIGTELSVGVNHYHYPFGDVVLGKPAECDPGLPYKAGCPKGNACPSMNYGLCQPDFAKGLSGGVAQQGFRAALDLKLLSDGQPMTRQALDAIVTSYVAFFDEELVALGLPERKIYSHTGGTFGPKGPHSFFPARARTVIPGWSMYGSGTNTPAIGEFVESSDTQRALPWAMPEWLPLAPDTGSEAMWHDAWEANLNYRNNRFVSLANWEGVYQNPAAIAGLAAALTAPRADACVTVPRTILGWADFGGTVGIRLSAQHGPSTTYLNASTSPDQVVGGGLATMDLANVALPDGATSYFFTAAGPVDGYVQVVTDGCVRNGAAQRMFAPLVKLALHGNGQGPSGPRLFSRRDAAYRTLAWEAPSSMKVQLQIASDPSFASLLVDEDVTGKSVFVRDGFDPVKSYVARIVADGVASNVVSP